MQSSTTSSQSQLAAALLGNNNTSTTTPGAGINATSSAVTTGPINITQTIITEEIIDDKDDVCEEENDDIIMEEDIIDEDNDENESRSINKSNTTPGGPAAVSRTITLQMLLEAGILQPGNGTMSIEYLGQRFIGDLLIDGKIKSQETDLVFASPSAWAIHCKRIINPEKKSGCGWASVKYKGRKLDAYKNTWFKRKQQEEMDREEDLVDAEMEAEMERIEAKLLATPAPLHRVVMKHNTVPNRAFTHDANTLIECIPFSTLGKIQPFLISFTTNACLLMDFHCHLTLNEVQGYLAGHWDVNSHNLNVTHIFPCLISNKNNTTNIQQIEKDIQDQIEQKKLTIVGWYHSHPTSPAAPTYKDIDLQLEFQIKMKGNCDSTYVPCIGCIVSPYNNTRNVTSDTTNSDTITNNFESNIINYWVIPPTEQKPNEYGRPMLMSYQIIQDTILTPPIMEQMKQCADFYKMDARRVDFNKIYIEQNNIKYLDKLKISLINKLPRGGEQSETIIWGFICELLGIYFNPNEQAHPVLSIPKITQQQSNLMITSSSTTTTPSTEHLVNVLGNKFTTQALLGLPLPPLSTSTTTTSSSSSTTTDLSIKSLTSTNLPPTFLTPTLYNKIIQQHDAINLLSSTTSIKIPQTDITLIKSSSDNSKLIDLIEFNNLINNKNLLNKKVIDFTNANDLSISSHQINNSGNNVSNIGGGGDELMKLQSQSSSLSVTPSIITTTSSSSNNTSTNDNNNDNNNKNQTQTAIINLEQQK